MVRSIADGFTGGEIANIESDLVIFELTVIIMVRAALAPQPEDAVTLSVPEVALDEKLIFTELVVPPVIVAPLPV